MLYTERNSRTDSSVGVDTRMLIACRYRCTILQPGAQADTLEQSEVFGVSDLGEARR